MLSILITVYLVVFALMMRKDLDDSIDNRSLELVEIAALVTRWIIWPLLSLGQLIYIVVKAVKK